MKIGIIGCGATGSVFASYLALGGANDLWMIDMYQAHMDMVRESGLTMNTAQGSFHVDGLHATTNAEEVGVCDILIVVVKSTQTESAMESAKCCIGPNTIVCSLQNGLGNEIPLKKYVPEDRILCGVGRIGTELSGPGVCVARPNLKLTNLFVGQISARSEAAEAAGKYLVEAFEKGGLRPQYCEDVRPYIWNKAGSNSGFNTVCAVLRLKVEEATACPDGMALVDQVFAEIGAVGEAMGIPGLYQKLSEDKPNVIKSLTGYYPSMAQDMLIRRCKTEVDFMTGAISHYGKQVGVPTPTCDVLSQIVRAIEVNYDKQYLAEAQTA